MYIATFDSCYIVVDTPSCSHSRKMLGSGPPSLRCLDEGEYCVTPPYLPIIHRQYLMHVLLQMKADLMGVLQGESSHPSDNCSGNRYHCGET